MTPRGKKPHLLDPIDLSRITSLRLTARAVVEGFLSGVHQSPFHGHSAEFSEFKPYIPGEDIRRVDWRVYARTDRYYVRAYEEDRNLTCYLVLDSSGSMSYQGGAISKFTYARMLAASLGCLMSRQGDRVSLLGISDRVEYLTEPGTGGRHEYSLYRALELLEPGGGSRLGDCLERIAASMTRKSLIVLISDLHDSPPEVVRALRQMRRARHDLIVFQLLDRGELEPAFDGPVEIVDLETGETVTVDGARVWERYRQRLGRDLEFYDRELSRDEIDLVRMDTSEPMARALMRYLRNRGGTHGYPSR